MALLTSPGPILRESMGSLTYLQIPLTTGSTSDTYSLGANIPVVNTDVQGESTTPGQSNGGDATYVASTGIITIVTPSGSQGAITLTILMRG